MRLRLLFLLALCPLSAAVAQSLDIQGVELRIGMSADSALARFKKESTTKVSYEPATGNYHFYSGDETLGKRGMIRVENGSVVGILKMFDYEGVTVPAAFNGALEEMTKRMSVPNVAELFRNGCVWKNEMEAPTASSFKTETIVVELDCPNYELTFSLSQGRSSRGESLYSATVFITAAGSVR